MNPAAGHDIDPETVISIAAAATLLKIGPERVRQLIKEGHVPRAGHGLTTLGGAVQGYSASLKKAGREAFSRGLARGRAKAPADTMTNLAEALRALDPAPAQTRSLICRSCGKEFERPITAGRKPLDCDDCPPYKTPSRPKPARICGCGASLTGRRRFCEPCGAAREKERLRRREIGRKRPSKNRVDSEP